MQKIQKGEFVDMSKMLQDNIQLEKKAPGSETSKQHKNRELSEDSNGLLSWVECLVTYSQILLAKYPDPSGQVPREGSGPSGIPSSGGQGGQAVQF